MIAANPLRRGVRAALMGALLGGVGSLANAASAARPSPLPSAALAGVGPLALPNLGQHVLGCAFVYGSAQPDLFVAGRGGPRGLYLCRWLRNDARGVPVFAPLMRVKSAFTEDGALVQLSDGTIHAGWIHAGQLVHTVFDRDALAWTEIGRMPIMGLPKPAQGLALLPNPDGSWNAIFEVADEAIGKASDAWTEEWRPYNAAGIWTGGFPYRYLYAATMPRLLERPLSGAKQISATQREVYFGMNQIAVVNLGAGHARDLISGSRQGVLAYYHNRAGAGLELAERRLVAGEDGITLRHPHIAAGVAAFSTPGQGLSDLIVGGEGALMYYAFTGRFADGDRPMFQAPTAVLQENADLYAGSLPVPSVIDWNGDGVLDLVVGNSEGRVLFFENTGTDAAPEFLPGVALTAGGRPLHVQAGYSGSVQGVQEARWRYASPNVTDWNDDGLPDIVMGDITGNLTVYLNRGTKRAPALEAAHPIYCDGLDLRGMWRVRPAVAKLGRRNALVMVDGEDHLRLYRQIDAVNVEDAGKLKLKDGTLVSVSSGPGGLTGRCKLDLFDWDGDGLLDLVIGTCRSNAIPNRETGFPRPTLGPSPLATVLLMKNVGTQAQPRFEHPVPFVHATMGIVQAGGAHESGAVATTLGGGGPNLLVGDEAGRLFLLRGAQLSARKSDWPQVAAMKSADLVLADFEGAEFRGWKVTGAAFGQGPVRAAAVSAANPPKDGPLRGALESAEFTVERDYLNFWIAGGDHAFRAVISLWVDGRVVRTSTGRGADQLAPATWDVREFRGKSAWLGIYDQCIEDERGYVIVDAIRLSDTPDTSPGGDVAAAITQARRQAVDAIRRNAPRAAADPNRPIFHYAPPAQRMNDPNGPAWAHGFHHVFYQHMVFEGAGPAIDVHWGHARSRDLVNWETLPLAIHPAYERGELSCFSGNLAWDKQGEPVQFVTMVPYRRDTLRQIWPARPLDAEWIRWEPVAELPPAGLVPHGAPDRNLKDAFPFSAAGRRFLVLTDRNIPIYEALDEKLTRWVYRGLLDEQSAECPNFFEVDGRWVYLSSPNQPVRYQVGTFDPATVKFTPATEGRINHDMGYYATTAYRDDRGRTILHGVSRGQKSSPAWTGVLALPRVLTIGPDDRPRMTPVPELASLRRKAFRLSGPVSLGDRSQMVDGLRGDTLEIIARFKAGDAKAFGLRVRRSADGKRSLPVMWRDGRIVVVKDTPNFPCEYRIDEATREIVLRVFLDKGMLDACTGDGRVFESRVHQAPLEDLGVEIFAEGGTVTLLSLDAWEMAPAQITHSRLLK